MRFSQDQPSNVNVIRGYRSGELRINDTAIHSAVILNATAMRMDPRISSIADLSEAHIAHVLALEPEIVLLGTGSRQVFPPPAFGFQFLKAGIGFEVMDTGAACRTFNVLVSELRRVVALLLI